MAADTDLAALKAQLASVPDPVALLAGVFAFAPLAFQIYEADGHCLLVNPAFRALFGSEPPPDYNVLQDEIAEREGVLSLIRRAFAGETIELPPVWYDPRELEQVKVLEGRRVAIEATFFPLLDAGGTVTHVAVVFRDRTELELEKERLVASEARAQAERDVLRAILDQSAEGIVVADAAGVIRIFNAAAERQHGVTRHDVAPGDWARTFGLLALDGPELPLEATPLYRALHGETIPDACWRVRQPNGNIRTLAGSATPLRNADGTAGGAVLVSRDDTERRAMESTLREREERYRGIVAALAEGITIRDRNGVLVDANASAERLLGASIDALRARAADDPAWGPFDEHGVPVPGEQHPAMIALRTGIPQTNVVIGLSRPDGERVWLSVNAQPIFDSEKRTPMGVVTSFFDVTALRRAADERSQLLAMAKAGEEHFRTLADTMPLLAWYAEPDGHIPWYNRRWYEYTGMAPEQQVGWKWQSVHDPDDVERVVARWRESLARGEPFDDQFRLRRHDGVLRWFLTRAEPLRDDTGRIIRWFGTNVDIDDQKRAERSLRTLAEAGVVLSGSLDLDPTLRNVTRLVVPALGEWSAVHLADDGGPIRLAAIAHADASSDGVMERLLSDALGDDPSVGRPEVIRTGVSELWSTAGLSPRRYHRVPPELAPTATICVPLSVAGRTFGALTLASSTRSYGAEDLQLVEELGRRVAMAIDAARLFALTQRERLLAEQANRVKDEFLSVASHELRTPLNAILGWSRMLQAGAVPEERRQRALETIERNAKAQVRLVEDILDVSRIITGKLRLEITEVEPAQVVDAAIEVVQPAADAKGVRIQSLIEPDAGTLMADAGRFQQIVWNLLTNAIKFTAKGGRVHVRLQRVDSHVELVVADTGVGIQAAFLPYIFQPFRQADSTATRSYGGLGLGLSIVKHLVELHGGIVEAHSEGANAGAAFTVRIPIAPLRGSASTPAVKSGARPGGALSCPPGLHGLRVLVVDDDADARELVRSILEECGASVRAVSSAREAMLAITAEIPAVLVSDIGMPFEDGYALVRQLRALPASAGGRVPAVALTAYTRHEDRTRALMEGFTNHVSKPVEPQELLAVVAAVAGPHAKE